MPYYGDGTPHFYSGPYANHSSLMTGSGRSYHNPIAARYSPHLSTISESPLSVLRRYSPAASTTKSTISTIRPHRVIDTADIDVSKPPRTLTPENRQQRHRLRRDRPTVKIRSQALKDNPALREYNEKHEKTVGELLVEKFLIKDMKSTLSPDPEAKMKLYHQASLIPSKRLSLDHECDNDILDAIRRRVTRRMTRRRSSADIVPLNPEQLEREAAFHAAQAVALDTLVAEEQAELEVEARRGTFAKRPLMKLPSEISEVSETEDDELEQVSKADLSNKHLISKKKKKKKSLEKDAMPINDSVDESEVAEEEFEWDDREKCDDIRLIVPATDEKIYEKDDETIIGNIILLDEKARVIKPTQRNDDDKLKSIRGTKSTKKENTDLKNDANDFKKDINKRTIGAKVKTKDKPEELEVTTEKSKKSKKEETKVDEVQQTKKINKQDVKTKNLESQRVIEKILKNDDIKLDTDNALDRIVSKTGNNIIAAEEKDCELKVKDNNLRVSKNNIKVIKEEEEVLGKDDINTQEKVPSTKLKHLNRTVSAPDQEVVESKDDTPTFKVEACNSVGDFSTLFVKSSNSPPLSARTIEQFRESIRLPAPRKFGSAGITNIETKVVLPVRKPYIRDTSRNSVYLALKPSQNIRQRQFGASDISSNIIDEIRKESIRGSSSIRSKPAKCSIEDKNQSKVESSPFISEESDALTLIDCFDNEINADSKVEASPRDNSFKKSVIRHKEEVAPWWDEIQEETEVELEKESSESKVDILEKSKDQAVACRKVNNKAAGKSESTGLLDKSEKSVNSAAKNKIINKKIDTKEKVTKTALQDQTDEKLKKLGAHKKEQLLPKELIKDEEKKSTEAAKKIPIKDITLHGSESDERKKEKSANNDVTKTRHELLFTDHCLSNIPEEPKSASPTENKELELFKIKSETNDSNETKDNKTKEKSSLPKKSEQSFDKLNLTPESIATKNEKEDRKKKVDAEAIMKIEKKILEEAESPRKILTTAIPETQLIEASSHMLSTKKEEELESTSLKKKVGLPPTKKKSSETAVTHSPEIDFWSEIKAQDSEKVSGTQRKAQLHDDSLPEDSANSNKPEKKLKLGSSGISPESQEESRVSVTADEDEKTPLVSDKEDSSTLSSEPVAEVTQSRIPSINYQLTDDNKSWVVDEDASFELDQKYRDTVKAKEPSTSETSGTVKKISKWTNHDNLSKLHETDGDATPIASKEVSPQVSVAPTTTKKKVTKKKKASTTGKKKSDKGEGSKTSNKANVTVKKAAPATQAAQLKTPMSVTGSPRNTPSQRPADLKKLFYTTPAILLTATPRDLRKVRRAKAKKKNPTIRTLSMSSDSTGSTRSTATTTSTEDSSTCEEDAEHRRLASTRSNDSGFDGSPRLSNCDMVCHKKCEKLTGNLCGLNQKLVAEALQAVKKAPSQTSDNQRNADGEHYQHSGRITPPATNLPRFKKYEVTDFNFLKVLGKGSFGKVLLAELRGTDCVYAVKCLKKDVVLEDDDVECTLIERKVLTLATRHPYLCHLFCTFQTESHLFFVMEYLNGGDLMFHIQKSGRFSEPRAKFYAAEIWSGLIFLHKKGIVYRDLKLDNVLLDFEGHIRIADFGMCKLQIFLDRTADTFCGTPDYMAPEIIKGLKYNQAVDWWSFGVLLYEMLTGQSPFSGCDEDELFWSICNERPFIPRYLSQSSTDILVCLLEKDAGKRIPGHEIACHSFFCSIAWDKLERRALEAPFKPAVEHTLDTRYFDTAFTAERPRLTPVPDEILTSMDQAVFRGFSYTNPNATD